MKSPRYEVRIKRSAEKEMDRLTAAMHARISALILSLEQNPRPRGCRSLRGQGSFRVRCGDYRILHVFAVGHRRDVYQNI